MFISNFINMKRFKFFKYVSSNLGIIYINKPNNLIINRETERIYGKYDKENDKILKLNVNDVNFLQFNKLRIDFEILDEEIFKNFTIKDIQKLLKYHNAEDKEKFINILFKTSMPPPYNPPPYSE